MQFPNKSRIDFPIDANQAFCAPSKILLYICIPEAPTEISQIVSV